MRLSASLLPVLAPGGGVPFKRANVRLSTSEAGGNWGGADVFKTAKVRLSVSPGDLGNTGRLVASRGSEPNSASMPSEKPSPSLSAVDRGLIIVAHEDDIKTQCLRCGVNGEFMEFAESKVRLEV